MPVVFVVEPGLPQDVHIHHAVLYPSSGGRCRCEARVMAFVMSETEQPQPDAEQKGLCRAGCEGVFWSFFFGVRRSRDHRSRCREHHADCRWWWQASSVPLYSVVCLIIIVQMVTR
jgi:hypothetical protein